MERIFRTLLLSFIVLFVQSLSASAADPGRTDEVDWDPVIDAIIQVESSGDSKATSGNSAGAMQITPVLVEDCNQILASRKSKKKYKLSDRFSVKKSKEMFLLIQSQYNPLNDIEKAIRSWNGGVNYSIRRTQRYFEKVMKAMR